MDREGIRESYRTSGTEHRVSRIVSGSRQEADVKEEVVASPESAQQLEPEYLNCAADVSFYRQDSASTSSISHGHDIKNGEESDDLHPGEIATNQALQRMDLDSQNIDAVTSSVKRLSGEESSSPDGDTDMRALCECCKRSRLHQEPQPVLIDGNKPLSPDSVCEDQAVTDSLASASKDDRFEQDHVEKEAVEDATADSMPEKTEKSIGENVTERVTAEVHYYQAGKASESRKTLGQPCTLEQPKVLPTDIDEDLYRDEEEIEKEKTRKVVTIDEKGSKDDPKLGVGPEVDIIEYCRREWRGKTTVAEKMKEGYEEVSHFYGSIRRIRGDNYCAIRATLFQCLSQSTEIPQWLDDEGLFKLPEELSKTYKWMKLWRFWSSAGNEKPWLRIKEYLDLLKKTPKSKLKHRAGIFTSSEPYWLSRVDVVDEQTLTAVAPGKWTEISKLGISQTKQEACDKIFQVEEEYYLYEAVKFLMLRTAINLYNASEDGKEVPVFSWLLFARNTSNNPCEFMKNHLNHVGHSGGLEQVEMFLLGYALQHTIKVYRLYKYGTDEFITQYPDDQRDWPVVNLITEDDRHYNVPVRMCEETSF